MALEMHSNDNAREGKPALWIFEGRSVAFLVGGVAAFVALLRICDAAGLNWYFSAGVSLLPMALATLYVASFVNGKPPSYSADLLLFTLWRLRCRLYKAGLLDAPPQFWVRERKPYHPNQF
jgi:hypothetical protein